MKYFRPQTINEAVELSLQPNMYFVAGGTDLILNLKAKKIEPVGLIDLGNTIELKKIKLDDESLRIGSMATFTEMSKNEYVREHAYALWLACQTMGSPQIRNQATIGGNLGNCSPAADGIPPLLALGAEVELISPEGEELVSLSKLLERNPLITPGTLIKGFIIPLGWKSGFSKLGRRKALAIARLSAAVAAKTEGNRIENLRIAFGAVGKRAFLSEALAQSLSGQEITDFWLEKAVDGAQQIVKQALGDRASAPYKRIAVGGVMRSALSSFRTEGGEKTHGN